MEEKYLETKKSHPDSRFTYTCMLLMRKLSTDHASAKENKYFVTILKVPVVLEVLVMMVKMVVVVLVMISGGESGGEEKSN